MSRSTASKELPENPASEKVQGSHLTHLFTCLPDVLKKRGIFQSHWRISGDGIFLVRLQEISVFKNRQINKQTSTPSGIAIAIKTFLGLII